MTRAADATGARRSAAARLGGCFNVRDLGGLRTADGRVVRRGALVRADALERLTAAGWRALEAHGVRTVVDLRNADEIGADAAPRPAGLTTVRLALDRIEDREFWDRWSDGPVFGTPLYYRPHLDRFAHASAAVVAAIAHAAPGGVAYHCAGGRDRTGMITILLLALAGVDPGRHRGRLRAEPRAPRRAVRRPRARGRRPGDRGVPAPRGHDRRGHGPRPAARPRRRGVPARRRAHGRRRRRPPRPDARAAARDWLTAWPWRPRPSPSSTRSASTGAGRSTSRSRRWRGRRRACCSAACRSTRRRRSPSAPPSRA